MIVYNIGYAQSHAVHHLRLIQARFANSLAKLKFLISGADGLLIVDAHQWPTAIPQQLSLPKQKHPVIFSIYTHTLPLHKAYSIAYN